MTLTPNRRLIGLFVLFFIALMGVSIASILLQHPPNTAEFRLRLTNFANGWLVLIFLAALVGVVVWFANWSRWSKVKWIPNFANWLFISEGFKLGGIPLIVRFILMAFFYSYIIAMLRRSFIPIWLGLGMGSLETMALSSLLSLITSLAMGSTWKQENQEIYQTLMLTSLVLVLCQSIFRVDILFLDGPIRA